MSKLICATKTAFEGLTLDKNVVDQLIDEINKSQLLQRLDGNARWEYIHRIQSDENAKVFAIAAMYLTYVSDIRYKVLKTENNVVYITFFFEGDEDKKESNAPTEEYNSPFDTTNNELSTEGIV